MVRDISLGGMQLKYLPHAFTNDQCELIDMISNDENRVLISGLSCEIVYDFPDLMENGSFSGKDVRRCGVRFDRLTEAQNDRLNEILSSLPVN